jgi:aryl-alcohol dehydrogenase-like predicted oxidoreductase
MDLYMQHWPGFAVNGWCNDAYLTGLADCADAGLCDAVGVSNFNAKRVRSAAAALASRGLPLASNQVQYSLLYREPERNGVLEACREAGTTLVAYSPLAQGLLTGKYAGGAPGPSGPRAAVFTASRTAGIEPLLALMREIGAGRGVRLRLCLCAGWAGALTHGRRLHRRARRQGRLRSTGASARVCCPSRASRTSGRPPRRRAHWAGG